MACAGCPAWQMIAPAMTIAELIFGLTAFAPSINNEQTVRFHRGTTLIPALVISGCLACPVKPELVGTPLHLDDSGDLQYRRPRTAAR
jgi:hypothetical protein